MSFVARWLLCFSALCRSVSELPVRPIALIHTPCGVQTPSAINKKNIFSFRVQRYYIFLIYTNTNSLNIYHFRRKEKKSHKKCTILRLGYGISSVSCWSIVRYLSRMCLVSGRQGQKVTIFKTYRATIIGCPIIYFYCQILQIIRIDTTHSLYKI